MARKQLVKHSVEPGGILSHQRVARCVEDGSIVEIQYGAEHGEIRADLGKCKEGHQFRRPWIQWSEWEAR